MSASGYKTTIWDGFYKCIIDDFLSDGRKSVIYGYYRDELKKNIESYLTGDRLPSRKKVDHILSEYNNVLKNPSEDRIYDFVLDFLRCITEKQELYNYPCKIQSKKNNLIEICNAVKPFVISEEARAAMDENNKGPKIKKKELNDVLKESLSFMTENRVIINPGDVETLVSHVMNRIIFKSFDDFLYTSGYKITGWGGDDEENIRYERINEEKGRKEAKADKTLDLIYRYFKKTGMLPFDITDLNNTEYIVLCKRLYDHLNASVNKQEEGLAIAIPLAVDAFTGCSLQILGNKYYVSSQKEGDNPFAYAVVTRMADEGAYEYAFWYDDNVMLYEDFESARFNYMLCRDETRDDIVGNNARYLESHNALSAGIPARFRFFFDQEDLANRNIRDDTVNDIMEPYDDEDNDEEFIPRLNL